MATASPDPVTQAAAYQQHLLGLLGQDDPAQVQAATRARLLAVLEDAGSDLRRTPAPGEWSVLELLGHLVDAEIVLSGRYRWVLSHDRPPLLGYDQDRWVERLRHNDDAPEELLEVRNFGETTLREVKSKLEERGLTLGMRIPPRRS